MINAWSWIKKVLVGVGVFIAGFFLIRRGIGTVESPPPDSKGKAKQDLLESKAELEKIKNKQKINAAAEEKKKKAAEDLKKKSKNSKTKPKKKKESLKNSPKKTQKRLQKSSKRGSR